MKKQKWITSWALKSSILLWMILLSAVVSEVTSRKKPLSDLIAESPLLAESLTQAPVSPTPTSTTKVMNENEKFNFELLHDAAKRNYERYMNVVWGSFGFLLIAIGWIMTSENTRMFLHRENVIRNAALAAIMIIFVFHVISLTEAVLKSQDLLSWMEKDPYVKSSIQEKSYYYKQYEIPWKYPAFGIALNGVLFLYLFIMIKKL